VVNKKGMIELSVLSLNYTLIHIHNDTNPFAWWDELAFWIDMFVWVGLGIAHQMK